MKKLFFTMMLAIVSSVWVMSEAQCLVPATEQEGPFVEELTGLLCLDAYPCPYEENCPTCLTMVLRTKEKKYYLTGSVMESIDAPTDRQYVKVVVSGITGSTELGNNEYYNWLKVGKLRYSEEPVTTNIQTHGYVEDESGTRLEGIRVIVHTADRTVSDTVYTHEGGEFVSTIKGIVYPVDSMYVTVSDVSERFKEQRKSTTYTYECGVEFNPETDTGFNSQELLFVLQEKTPSSERWCMPQERVSEGKTIRVGGTLKEVSAPCISDSEEEPCLPCITIALKSRLKTYYVVSDDAEVLAILDTVSEGLPAIAEGIAFTNGSYSYLQVSKIKPVIVSEFQQRLIGTWQVYKEELTGNDYNEQGELVELTRTKDDIDDLFWVIKDSVMYLSCPTCYSAPMHYTVEYARSPYFRIIIPGRFDTIDISTPAVKDNGSPIEGRFMSETEIEWGYSLYGGDAGPRTYQQYISKVSSIPAPSDTVPLYIKDGPGTSPVEPVDPNQIVATLVGDMLSIYEYIGAEIGYKLTKAPTGNNMPARGKEMADDTFSESVSIQLTERGLYTLELTNPEWGYTIVGTFEYDGMQGIEPVETVVPAAQKILRNGQLLIRKGDRTYTIQGIELRE